jgi:hypothetical protein
MTRFFRAAIFVALIFCARGAVAASNWYVHKGATGANNGTSWTNAWNEMNQINFSGVACGDTIWLAGGTYTTTLAVNKTCTSSSVLNINRVNLTDAVPVAAAGWQSSFDSQVALLNANITIQGAYVTISGRIGAVASNNFGIQVQCGPSSNGCDGIDEAGTASHFTMSYIESYGPACAGPAGDNGTCTNTAHGLHATQTTDTLLFDHGWIHRYAVLVYTANWTNGTIQYTQLDSIAQTPNEHEDISYNYTNTNFTMRYNTIYGNPNDGIFFDFGGTTNFQFYGNVYYHSGGALITFKQGYSFGTAFIYNNVFQYDGAFGDFQGFIYDGGTMTGGAIENNIFENVTLTNPPLGQGFTTADYNAYATSVGKQDTGAHSFTYNAGTPGGSPLFIAVLPSNPNAVNFRLTSSGATTLQNGVTLPSPFNMDPDGNTRGSNGHWYIGAYDFGSTPGPQPPTSLSIKVQ